MRRLLTIAFLLLAPCSLLAQVTGRGYGGASPNSNSGNIGVGCRTVTGSSDSGGIVTTDRAACIEYTATGAVSETLPQAGTAGFGFNFPVKLISAPSSGSQTVTVTITTSTATVVNGYSVALSQTSFQLTTGQFASVNSPDNTNYFVTITTGGSGGSGCTFSGGAQYDLITAAASGGPCTPANVKVDSTLNNLVFPTPSGTTYGTVTTLNTACYTASQQIGNCGTSATNVLGVFVNSSGGYQATGWLSGIVLDGTQSPVYGDILCASTTTGGEVHDNGSILCGAISFIGIVSTSATSVTTVSAWLAVKSPNASGTQTIASGTASLGTSAISSATCATVVTVSASGVATTDNIMADFNADPTSTTGYAPSASGMLTIIKYPTANNVNFKVCNNTGGSITPGAVTLNWRVVR